MFLFRSKIKSLCLTIPFLMSFASIGAHSVEEVTVLGTPGGYGYDYERYLPNTITANQLRSLYDAIAQQALAEALAAAERAKSEDERKKTEREKCEAQVEIKHMHCLNDAADYKAYHNKPCYYLESTVGNMPMGNPAGACYARVMDQFDIFVSNCNLFRATNRSLCIK
jgi:hypothetical protein